MTSDPFLSAETQQRVFRRLLTAMARPGMALDFSDLLDSAPVYQAVLATLVDGTVLLSDPNGLLDARCWQFLQAVACAPEKAAYIIADGGSRPDFEPRLGTLESPEFGATIILTVPRLGSGSQCLTCSGPGIEKTQDLCMNGLHPQWLLQRKRWNAYFPLGVDFLFADACRIAALPRTARLAEKGV